jgi:hypothetical protein
MDKIQKPKTPSEAEQMAELGCVPMSSEALSKMSLNPYDQLFICRLMTMRDDAAKDEMYNAVAEVVVAQNKRMFEALDEQTKLMKGMVADIADIKTRLTADEGTLRAVIQRLNDKKKRIDGLELDVKNIKKRLGVVERGIKTFKK